MPSFEPAFTFLFKYPSRVFERGTLVLAPVVPGWALAVAVAAALVIVVWGVLPGSRGQLR